MEQITIDVTQGVYKTAKEARQASRIPIIYYGKGVEPVNFSVDYQDFRRVYKKTGKSAIITMVNEKKKEFSVLVQEIQYHPVSDKMIHVDMIAVDLNKAITTEVPLVFVGQSPAVKEDGGIFITSKDVVTVECLPKDLIQNIEVDISHLVDFRAIITVGDLKVPDTIKILDSEDVNIASVSAPRTEEELEALEEEVPAEGEEVEGEAPAEGEEKPAEGEEKPAEGEEKPAPSGAEGKKEAKG